MTEYLCKTSYAELPDMITKDGSIIRELMHPSTHSAKQQSLAEAIILPAQNTKAHRHHRSEEIYHVTSGNGIMHLNNKSFPITQGDTVCIAPGQTHWVSNSGSTDLIILCCCSPPYSHDDTEIL